MAELHVCISCGRRDTASKSMICKRCSKVPKLLEDGDVYDWELEQQNAESRRNFQDGPEDEIEDMEIDE